MTEKSRTEYSARNTTIAMISRIIAIVMGYVTRIVFTHTLSESYVGVNGLFTDILNVLALSELGVGTALTYALYRPIAQKNIEEQKSLMRLFKWMYRIVALLIASIGLLIVPFLGNLIHDGQSVDHVIIIYLLYLSNSVVSYLLVYKKTLVDAHQKSYIGVLYHTIFLIIQDALQIVILVTTHNFILFLLIYLACTIGNNLCIAKKADSLYPYLRDKDVKPIPKEEKQGIIKNMKAMLMHKIGTVLVNNTDNLLLSAMVGLVSVGKYSNYYLIIGSVRQVLDQAFQGITASVGNFGVTENKERVKTIFEASFFIGQWIYGFAGICLFQLLNAVVTISFGENYVFPKALVLVLCINFFVTGMRQATLVFRDSLGLFWYDRYKSLVEAVINLVASILLTLKFGIIGVFLGTFISTMLTSFWIEPYVLYRKKLESAVTPYFVRYALYTLVVVIAGIITNVACAAVKGDGFYQFIVRLMLCVSIPNILFLILYHRTENFRFLWKKAIELLKKKRKSVPGREEKKLDGTDEKLLEMLKSALTDEQPIREWEMSFDEWDELLYRAGRHTVLSILYDTFEKQGLAASQAQSLTKSARGVILRNYHLLYCTKEIIDALKVKGITAAVLKGVSVAAYYKTPELRQSGDIDILLPYEDQLLSARDALSAIGYVAGEKQMAHHHLVMYNGSGIEVELHIMLAEPFDNADTNNYLNDLLRHIPENIEERNIMGYDLPVLTDGYQAYELLLHMLQHFLRSGFGLKLLCDWVVFWNRAVSEEDVAEYLRLVDESGIGGFSRMITSVCAIYLGLDRNSPLIKKMNGLMDEADVIWFIEDVLEAETFGKSSKDRMVVLRGTALADYVREFHHAMHLNFPKAGNIFVIWPVLWAITLFRFVHNNRSLRKVTTSEILKKAGERSRVMKKMELFKTRRGRR